MKPTTINICLLFCTLILCNCTAKTPAKIVIVTDFGDIELELYDKTLQHRDNFIKLVKEGYYDGTLFHRVIKQFMIQGGDPNSKNAQPGAPLGSGGPNYTIPAEFVPEYIHQRGALAAARTGNPAKASSGSQFYIVQGKTFTDEELDQIEVQVSGKKVQPIFFQYIKEEEDAMQKAGQTVDPKLAQEKAIQRATAYMQENPYHMKAEVREMYKTIGGSPHLDGEYTVFGRVIKGMEIVDKIADMETVNERPTVDVKIKKMRIVY